MVYKSSDFIAKLNSTMKIIVQYMSHKKGVLNILFNIVIQESQFKGHKQPKSYK